MANYKSNKPSETPLYDDNGKANPQSSGTIDTFGSWLQIVGDVGLNKAIYNIHIMGLSQVNAGKGTIVEISIGASSSEVTILRFSLSGQALDGMTTIPVYKKLADNVRLASRVKDGEASVNNYKVNVDVGIQ